MPTRIREGKQVNVSGTGFIPGDLISRCNVYIVPFSEWEGDSRGECAVSIVEDVGGNAQERFLVRGAIDSQVLDWAHRASEAGEAVRWMLHFWSAGPKGCSATLTGRKAFHITEFRAAREESLLGWIMCCGPPLGEICDVLLTKYPLDIDCGLFPVGDSMQSRGFQSAIDQGHEVMWRSLRIEGFLLRAFGYRF